MSASEKKETAAADAPAAASECAEPAPVLSINDLHREPLGSLLAMAQERSVRLGAARTRDEVIHAIIGHHSRRGGEIRARGAIEWVADGQIILRYPQLSYRPGMDGVRVPPSLAKQHCLEPGVDISVAVSAKEQNRPALAERVLKIEGAPAADWDPPTSFDKLTPLFPDERIVLERAQDPPPTTRVIDLIAPLGKGQRALIAAPPRAGKTVILLEIAESIAANLPEADLIVLLIDERPEEVSDFQDRLEGSPALILSSTFDEPAERHAQLSDLALERAKRLVEQGRDVVILLDSLTRLARGHNASMGGRGRIMSGGLDAKALIGPRKFFGAARNIEHGGSLTIIATALVETESKMDEVIFEEFKGTGNLEIMLDRELAERRVYPAIHIPSTATRKDELLYHPEEFRRILDLRRQLAKLPAPDAMEGLLKAIAKTASNAELLLRPII